MDPDTWRREVDNTVGTVTRFIQNALVVANGLPSQGQAAALWAESLAGRQIVNRMADLFGVLTGTDARKVLRDNGLGNRAKPQDFSGYGLRMDLSSLAAPPRTGEDMDEVATGEFLARQVTAEVTRQAAQEVASRGGSRTKTWVTQQDAKVRDSHRPMEGVTIPVNEPFNVSGWPMMWPGEASAPTEYWINCRCSTILDMEPPPVADGMPYQQAALDEAGLESSEPEEST